MSDDAQNTGRTMTHECWDLVLACPGTILTEGASRDSISPPVQGQVEKDCEQGKRADIWRGVWGGENGKTSPWRSHQKDSDIPCLRVGLTEGRPMSHNK